MDNDSFKYLRDPDIPFCFMFVFNAFLEIYSLCKETITWTDIASYAIMRKIDFRQKEIDLILKCNNWANEQIRLMKEDAEGQTSAD